MAVLELPGKLPDFVATHAIIVAICRCGHQPARQFTRPDGGFPGPVGTPMEACRLKAGERPTPGWTSVGWERGFGVDCGPPVSSDVSRFTLVERSQASRLSYDAFEYTDRPQALATLCCQWADVVPRG